MTLVDILNGYQQFSESHGWISSAATAQVLLPLCDIIAQKATRKPIDWKQVTYMAKLSSGYGLGLHALMLSGELPEVMGIAPDAHAHPDANALTKSALGPNLWGNAFNALLYVNRAIGQRTEYSVRALGNYYAMLTHNQGKRAESIGEAGKNAWRNLTDQISRNDYLVSVGLAVTAWNAVQYANFRFVPHELQTAAAIGASLVLTPIVIASTNRAAVRAVPQLNTTD